MGCFRFFWSKRRTREEPDVINITEVKALMVKPAAEGSLPAVVAATKSVKGKKATISAVPKISVQEVKAMTDNFGKKALLGAGSYGKVYLGRLKTSGQLVAFKKLDDCNQSAHKFLSQVSLVSKLEHKNVLGLVGYSIDGENRVLAYEYAPAGSLYEALHGSTNGSQHRSPLLSWTQRVKIALGAAEGLEYLHKEGMIHCNIKSSNILLLYDVAKIADFDLAHQEAARLNTSGDLGSFGYQDPAYAMYGQFTSESDVYSFGVILVELLTGRKPIDRSLPQAERSLVIWATTKFSDGMAYECVDPRLGTNYSIKGVTKIAAVAALCLQYDASSRPKMSAVVNHLRIT